MACELYLKIKIQWDQPECLMSPQDLFLRCHHRGGRWQTYPSPWVCIIFIAALSFMSTFFGSLHPSCPPLAFI